MKNKLRFNVLYVLAALTGFTSCQKDNQQLAAAQTAAAATQSALSSNAVAVGTSSGAASDSVYVVNTCSRGSNLDSIAAGSLPSSVTSYLTTNYSGYAFQKAFKVDSSGTLKGYVVIIQYNSKPVGLKFDANGSFVKVLEQREGHDLGDHDGWHNGGIFDDRGGKHKDSIALNNLPAAIQSYFTTNYPSDTLIRAFKNRDSSIVVISTNNGLFATNFTAAGAFLQRMALPAHEGRADYITQSALPATAQSYLSTTYPNYVFKQAYAVKENGTLQGYIVMIDANNTKYAVSFDAAGSFIKAITIR